ncbi:FAD-binding domain-containing protein [Periconia macrospinosa]|uniref:FAD-binding domain-containing protein n=1 Tax=Periconia macrospinosa TaxID=97972 RepID=A0A2V1DBV4_9PLEO|nr:FAD-binding domain-containing protein [Periconia macrospinosa]
MFYQTLALCISLAAFSQTVHSLSNESYIAACRCFIGDSCWPTESEWKSFNATIGGRLLQTTPIAASCHESSLASYNLTSCELLRGAWYNPQTHITSSSSIMAPLFTNNSCNPFLPPAASCTLGNYVVYSVNATELFHYQQALAFAKKHNIRLVVRNTGHDYNGKSTGASALAIWVHYSKGKEFIDYDSPTYTGKAFKFGAGISVTEAYEFAKSHGKVVVGANQPSVGLVGGYTQGGGHGPLASLLGLAADQVLEWEVMLASGQVVTASKSSGDYSDLHWALCGGGGGTYGVVISATVKAHKMLDVVSIADLTLQIPPNATTEIENEFYDAVGTFISHVPTINDAGCIAIWYITSQTFTLATLFAPSLSQESLDKLLQPVLEAYDTGRLSFAYSSKQYTDFLEAFQTQSSVEVSNLNIGGRLIPRELIDNDISALTASIRNITTRGALFSGVSFNVSQFEPESIGVNPYWRRSAFDAVVAMPFDWTNWSTNHKAIEYITRDAIPVLERLTPNGAAYLNEADFQQRDWQKVFYGAHYGRLADIKSKYDPESIFYALGAVGSESWVQKNDGRLCRAS